MVGMVGDGGGGQRLESEKPRFQSRFGHTLAL